MPTRRIGHALLLLFPLAIASPLLLTGCGGNSQTTGTQVQISEEAKAQIDDMRDMYKTSTKAQAKKK